MPFCNVKFELKSCRYNLFELWISRILAQKMEKFLKDLGILRSIYLAQFADVERNPVGLAFLVPRWSTSKRTLVAA